MSSRTTSTIKAEKMIRTNSDWYANATDRVSDQYAEVPHLQVHVKGELTGGENIADFRVEALFLADYASLAGKPPLL